jgi:predicted nucleic acid-binding protein
MSNADFILDASITLAWCFEDETSPHAEHILERLENSQAIVPTLWQLEVGNALLGAEQRGRLTMAHSARFLELLHNLPIRIEAGSPWRAWGEVLALARNYHLSTYDAEYLDLAIRLNLPLATADQALKQAATLCGVETL